MLIDELFFIFKPEVFLTSKWLRQYHCFLGVQRFDDFSRNSYCSNAPHRPQKFCEDVEILLGNKHRQFLSPQELI